MHAENKPKIVSACLKLLGAGRACAIFAENTSKQAVKGYKVNFVFQFVVAAQIGFDGVRNSEPKFSCLGPFKEV
jgi:hypothetical protein